MSIKLATSVVLPPQVLQVGYGRPVLMMGSCFTDEVGARMQASGMQVLCNPMGTLYNPQSIALLLRRAVNGQPITEQHLVHQDGLWHSWLHHGSFSHPDQQQVLAAANEAIHRTHLFLQQRPLLIITFGTAWVYHLLGNDVVDVVANCHKLPARNFERRALSVESIVRDWASLLSDLGLDTLFTISPIRHMADGAHGNQLSKATLLLAVEQLLSDTVHYFPSYEIMLDELRDYRFYARDLCHPSDLAVDIIWQRFQEAYMSPSDIEQCRQYSRSQRRQNHVPLHPISNNETNK